MNDDSILLLLLLPGLINLFGWVSAVRAWRGGQNSSTGDR